ncbi:MAG: hypothetical protein CSA35_09060 [Dethiosulfovibrio peptidovorans]|nr:MAG: hypothetical protein CSA35_09060 [Dethiosulfovibrio peptidovorans]
MDTKTMQMIVRNGHFAGYDIRHKKQVHRTILLAQTMADKLSQKRSQPIKLGCPAPKNLTPTPSM